MSLAEIRAAHGRPVAAAPRPARVPVTAQRIEAMSGTELKALLSGSGLTDAERKQIADELGVRQFTASQFPQAAAAAGYELARLDLAARSDAPLRGLMGGG